MVQYAQTVWILPMLAVMTIHYLGAAYWVYRDARRHGSDRAALWGVVALFFGLLVVAVYLVTRRNLEASAEPTRTDCLVRNLVVASVLTFLVPALVGPPDPFTQGYQVAVALPVLVGLAVLYTYRDALASAL